MTSARTAQIPADEVRFHELSIADPGGRVFWWKGDLYRGISASHAAHFQNLFDRGIIRTLVDNQQLVATEITDLQLAPFALIVKHAVIPYVTYAPEWTGPMLRSAADLVLAIQEQLLAEGLMLQDAHPWNVLFDGVHPRFVDLTSIVPAAPGGHWPAYDEFRRFFINPLKVMAAGHARVARWLLHDIQHAVRAEETAALCGEAVPTATPKLTAAEALQQARAELQSLHPLPVRTEWSTYATNSADFPSLDDRTHWNEKHRTMARLMDRLKPSTMLDIGGNRGWFSQLAARTGATVVTTDLDENSLNLLHADTLANGLNIQPLLMDFGNPLPGYGLDNSRLAPALDRLQSELVLALAVVHHMAYKQYLRFEHIVNGLATLSKRYVIVEFIAAEDMYVSRWPKGPDWYTLDNFLLELKRKFRTVEQFPSDIDHRVILLCEK